MRKEFEDMYKVMHQDENLFRGGALLLHAEEIGRLMTVFDTKSILDYGCGKGYQYTQEQIHKQYFYGIMPTLYDPAVEQHNKLPSGTFDSVICTDVLEHVPDELLDEIFTEIYSKADKFVYLGICTVLANSLLPDGRNSHVTVESSDWWINRILPFADKYTRVCCYGKNRGFVNLENNKLIFKTEF